MEKVDTSPFLKQKFISGLLSKPLKIRLSSLPLPTTFRSAVTVVLAHTAALYPDQQIIRSRSAIYKAAVYHPNPIVSPKRKENNIQSLVEEQDTDIMEMSTGKKGFICKDTCSVHRSSNHSNKECFIQHPYLKVGDTKNNSAQRKARPDAPMKKSKPFAGNSRAKRRFLRSILAKIDKDLSSSDSEQNSEQSDDSDADVLCKNESKENTVSMMDSHILTGDDHNEDPFSLNFLILLKNQSQRC